MDELLKTLTSYGPIGVVCMLLVLACGALWKRVVSMQGEVLQIAKDAVAAQKDTTAELRRMVDVFKIGGGK